MRYWLLKSEPDTFSIDDLKRKGSEHWDGVRNYQARNMMRDEMKKGDLALFYHSSCKEPGVVGIMTVAKEAYPDNSAHNPESPYYDPKSTTDAPRWFMVDMQFKRKTKQLISLEALKKLPGLADCPLIKRGNRLSIMPLSKQQWDIILSLE
jgi:predicted RNA-binding protein with PUA-like domain